MGKQTLLKQLISQGKNDSWASLATIHGIKNGEVARATWLNYRRDNGLLTEAVEKLTKDNKQGKLEKMIQEAKAPEFLKPYLPGNTTRTQLVELDFFDLHLGKRSWEEETGENYDLDIAVKRCKFALEKLISRIDCSKVERILLPTGNDMCHVDNKMGTTTAGTPVDADSRFGLMFKTAKELVIDTITRLSSIAPVDVVIVPGNHCEATIFTLGEVLSAWYRDDSRVTVNNSPKLRKYYQYGTSMIMLTHGDKEKHQELGLIAAHEESKMWSDTKFREVHLGHFHKSKSIAYTTGDEYPGFKVRILPSLSASDAWHYSQGYISMKGAKAFVWDKEEGLITEHTYNHI